MAGSEECSSSFVERTKVRQRRDSSFNGSSPVSFGSNGDP
jgi:hypothetical protein